MSSLYGAGQANAATIQIPAAIQTIEQATTTSTTTMAVTATSSPLFDSKDVESYVRDQYSDEPILVEVARCESTFRQYDKDGEVIRGKVNSQDVGVMQINEYYHADEAAKLGMNIYTIEGNVAFAKHLYDKFGTDPWSSSEKCWSSSSQLARK
jgi:hypothetical protein